MSTETTTRSNEEFMMEILRFALDFNSQIVSVATVEILGDNSARNRTHQKKVLSDIQVLGQNYGRKLDTMYDKREQELRGDEATAGFSKDDASAIRRVMGILDEIMASNPNRETADAHNYLEMILRTSDEPKDNINEAIEKGTKK